MMDIIMDKYICMLFQRYASMYMGSSIRRWRSNYTLTLFEPVNLLSSVNPILYPVSSFTRAMETKCVSHTEFC